jgi:hypothetical protein
MLDEAQERALIRSVLVETFPHESRRVGKTNLNDIVERRGQVRIVPIPGARLDWTEALILLANGAVLLSQWLTIRGKAEWHIHVARVELVKQDVQIGAVHPGGQVNVTGIDFQVPPDIADRLDPATVDRLISSFLAHLDAMDAQGSNSGEPE